VTGKTAPFCASRAPAPPFDECPRIHPPGHASRDLSRSARFRVIPKRQSLAQPRHQMETSRLIATQRLDPRSHHPRHPHSKIRPRQSLHSTQRVLPRSISIGSLLSPPRKLAESTVMSIYAFRFLIQISNPRAQAAR